MRFFMAKNLVKTCQNWVHKQMGGLFFLATRKGAPGRCIIDYCNHSSLLQV